MTVLHRSAVDGRLVEVRGAGRTRRLYVDVVFHSAWNPARPLTGAVWDHLVLPAFLVRGGAARSALVLGVGGGAALRMLDALVAPERLVGVEIDAALLRLARRWFGLDACGAELVAGDAREWVARHGGERFDLVVDDLFGEVDGEPVRPPGMDDAAWWRRVVRLVAPGGVLVVNFVAQEDLVASPLCQDVALRRRFPAAVRFSCPGYDNAAAAFLPEILPPRALRRRLTAHPDPGPAAGRGRPAAVSR